MKLLKQNAVRCGIVRSEPAENVPGYVTSWQARSITVLVSPRTGLELNEAVVVKIDKPLSYAASYPGCIARLYSRVVSIIWQDAGDLVGLTVWTAKTSELGSSESQPWKLTPPEQVS